MRLSVKLKKQVYFIVSDKRVSQEYEILDKYALDYDNLAITDSEVGTYFCLFTPELKGSEEKVALRENYFLRPTHYEPLIRGLYAALTRPETIGLRDAVKSMLGDIQLSSLQGMELENLAKSCAFSTKDRLREGRVCYAGHEQHVGPETDLIPRGIYCYNYTPEFEICPYWSLDKTRPEQENGFCSYLNKGDWEDENSCSLLWDQVKECQFRVDENYPY